MKDDLFVWGSTTSQTAAEGIRPSARTLRADVHRLISERGDHGATDDEIQVRLNMNPSTQRPRRVELHRDGYIVDSGRTRPTRSGRDAVVWVRSDLVAKPRAGLSKSDQIRDLRLVIDGLKIWMPATAIENLERRVAEILGEP